MSALRDSAESIARMGRFAARSPDRPLASEKAAAQLADRTAGNAAYKEPWDDFLRRIGVI